MPYLTTHLTGDNAVWRVEAQADGHVWLRWEPAPARQGAAGVAIALTGPELADLFEACRKGLEDLRARQVDAQQRS